MSLPEILPMDTSEEIFTTDYYKLFEKNFFKELPLDWNDDLDIGLLYYEYIEKNNSKVVKPNDSIENYKYVRFLYQPYKLTVFDKTHFLVNAFKYENELFVINNPSIYNEIVKENPSQLFSAKLDPVLIRLFITKFMCFNKLRVLIELYEKNVIPIEALLLEEYDIHIRA